MCGSYLEIVRLRACFRGGQRVYGRFGHFDLHHLLRAQRRGGMRTDMGYRRRRASPNTSRLQSEEGCSSEAPYAAHRTGEKKKNPSSSGLKKRKKRSVLHRGGARNDKTISEESQTDRTEASSLEQCAQVRTKCGSVPGVSVCGCEGCGNRFTLEYGNRIHTFTCDLLGFSRFSHGGCTSDTGIQRGNQTVWSIQSGDIQTGITGREIQGAGEDQQIAPLNVCIAQAHTLLIERVLTRVCWDLEQHNTSTWFGSYLRNR